MKESHSAKSKHKRRLCRVAGCTRVIKSQGVCQRHGAKPCLCKVVGCSKQAQGNFDGMCKAHFGELKRTGRIQQAATGDSQVGVGAPDAQDFLPPPLVAHLLDGHEKHLPAWHRNQEREARGYAPVEDPSVPFEDWERDLVCNETLLLTGSASSEESFECLAKAWGRQPGFHLSLSTAVVLEQYRSKTLGSLPEVDTGHDSVDNSGTGLLGEISASFDMDEDLIEFSRIVSTDTMLFEC